MITFAEAGEPGLLILSVPAEFGAVANVTPNALPSPS